MIQLSVLILNYKVPYYLMHCLSSVTAATKDLEAEIIVVDNNSEDQSSAWVKEYFPQVILVENKVNSGFSKGNNLGFEHVKGKYVCLLNPDTYVGNHTFKNVYAFAETKQDVGAIGVKLIDGCDRIFNEVKRALPTPKVALEKIFQINNNYYSALSENITGKVDVLVGAFMWMHRERYEEIGKLDEDYFMYGEDIDLSYKFLKAGYQNYYLGSESIIHYKGESTTRDKVYRQRFYGAMQIFYEKHFNKGKAVQFLVQQGLKLASLKDALIKKSNNEQVQKEYVSCLLVTNKTSALKERLEEILHHQFNCISVKEVLKETISDSYIVFDAEYIAADDIKMVMEKQKNKRNCFRIKPRNFNFILGSDQSTSKGEVKDL